MKFATKPGLLNETTSRFGGPIEWLIVIGTVTLLGLVEGFVEWFWR